MNVSIKSCSLDKGSETEHLRVFFVTVKVLFNVKRGYSNNSDVKYDFIVAKEWMWLCPYWVLCNNDEPWRQSKQIKKKLIVPKRLNGDPERRTHINLDISSKFELTCTTNVTFEMHDSSREQNTNTLKWMNWFHGSFKYFKRHDWKIIWQSGRHS